MINNFNILVRNQNKIINKTKNYIKKNYKLDINFSIREKNYFSSWANSSGKIRLKLYLDSRYLSFIFYYVLSLIRKIINNNFYYKILNFSNYKLNYKYIIFSTLSKNDIKNNEIYDRYFSCNIAKTKKVLWLVLYLDDDPVLFKKKPENLIIIQKKKINKIKYLSFLFWYIFFKKNNIFITINYQLNKIFSTLKFNHFFFPFESQPLNYFILKALRKNNSKIKTYGYIHAALPPLPTDFIYNYSKPDYVLVHGIGQKRILESLNWPVPNIKVINSFRYKKKNKNNFNNKIFLPYDFNNSQIIINNIKILFNISNSSKNIKNNKVFEIINHPYMFKSKKHILLRNEITNIIKNNFTEYKNVCICIGATATIIESLENGVEVVQISSDPIFEVHNPKLWKFIDVLPLASNIFHYKLKSTSKYILFKNKKNFEDRIRSLSVVK